MKTLIIYSSSRGATEKASRMIKENLIGEVHLLDLRKDIIPDLNLYETVIIGGSIHAGNFQSKGKKFLEKNRHLLSSKKLGLFLCCMFEGDKAKEQFENSFPLELRDKAVAKGLFGGEFIFSKMNFIEKQIIRKVSGFKEDTSTLKHGLIKDFADRINKAISAK
jgi:menaquinone-dependent protoporphyrinogen oxidase